MLNSIKQYDSLYTNEWDFVRYLHVINALWLVTNVEAQGHPFKISVYHVIKKFFCLLFDTLYTPAKHNPLKKLFYYRLQAYC